MKTPVDAVLLVGYGGPTAPDEVMPFLKRVVAGKDVPEARLQAVAKHYEAVGGRSPYNDLTRQLCEKLEHWLQERGRHMPVVMGMRNWHPLLPEAVAALRDDGLRHAAVIIMAPHRAETTWDRYVQEVEAAADGTIQVSFVAPYYDDMRFVEANAARLEETGLMRDGEWPEDIPVVFTAHSLPVDMAQDSPYVHDVTTTCREVAELLELPRWELAWQSRSGNPRTPWLEPDINDVLKRLAGENVKEAVVQAVGFLCDHVEVLYDLDVEAQETAVQAGLRLRRAGCVNDHPEFLTLLGERIIRLSGEAI
ncbi:MAG: ferrochelatase [Acidobacteria bacterium]|nr:ferrochelatase [Acidobacteriota bacterium]